MEPQRGALCQSPIGAPRSPSANPGFQASYRAYRPLVREASQDDEMRDHGNDHPGTVALLRGGNDTAKQGAITQSDDVRDDSPWGEAGTRWTTEQLIQSLD